MAGIEELSRRRVLQGIGAAGVLAGAAAMGTGPAQAEDLPEFTPRGRLKRRPNFLVIVVDEQRYPVTYESARLARWRRENLDSQNLLFSRGMQFTNHHIMASACAPSRASFFTGQYPSLHGVTQTSGAAKIFPLHITYWLDPATVPTMGAWFRAAGYDTFYKGKWHVSDADLYQPGSYNALPSYTDTLLPDPALEEMYLEANRLAAYGFDGWIGPEPHGSSPLNSASSGPGGRGRDELFAGQGARLLRDLRGSRKPWLVVTSFVNPHDITLWGDLTLADPLMYLERQLEGSDVPLDLFDDRYAVSVDEDLSRKPSCQASYRDVYPLALQPTGNNTPMHRFYYQLQKNVDIQIGRVLRALTSSRREYRDTIVIYLSDHGELLGAHGGLHQKWHNAYDEVVRVPFVIHNPQLFPDATSTNLLTSHADLLPTMIGLAGLDERSVARRLRASHTQVHSLPGRDLSGLILGEQDESDFDEAPQFFMTDDEIFRGESQVAWNGNYYQPVIQPNHLETVIAMLPTGADGGKQRWKLTRYWDNPQFWTTPGFRDVQNYTEGSANAPGEKTTTTTVKYAKPVLGQSGPAEDEWECYNVDDDPMELTNLYGDARYADTIAELKIMLQQQVDAKRIEPREISWANGVGGLPSGQWFFGDPVNV
ncbi:MAG: sulfatase-like hydrolase/transferase [Actinomycetota bacterium]|nr:sulfatase-like hydrolase/transferase [Actinomycetota bacterium]